MDGRRGALRFGVRDGHGSAQADRGRLGAGCGHADGVRTPSERLVALAHPPGGDPHADPPVRLATTPEGGAAPSATDRLTNLYRACPVARETVDYEALLKELYGLERFGIKLGLDVIRDLLRRLGDPQEAFPAIHVTWTNGKGSLCAYLASI